MTVDERVTCSYDGKEIPEGTTYLDCDGAPFCEWQCHDAAHGRCPAGRYETTPSAPPPLRCAVCSEPVERKDAGWIHGHGDVYCGTGDGATATPPPTPAPLPKPKQSVCGTCGVRLRRREGHAGRYAWEDWDTPDTAIFGSGSECPHNERGHVPVPDDQVRARLLLVRSQLTSMPRFSPANDLRRRLEQVAEGLSRALARAGNDR